MDEREFVTLTEAARRLGISRWTLYRRIDEGALTVYESPADRRAKFVKRSEVEAMATHQIASRDAKSGKGERVNGE
jgi:excisionase family DNA binding protein